MPGSYGPNAPRPGKRGPKPKPKGPEATNAAFDEKAMQALPELFNTLMTIANGYRVGLKTKPRQPPTVAMETEEGETLWVYTVPPDKAAAMYLVDRASGKAAVKSPEQTETELILEFVMPAEDEEEDASE